LSRGGFNIRAGHFEVPFGLEQNIDTNGTLRQYTFKDRGIKADWGFSVNGALPELDYEIAVTRGSGNDIESKDDPYIFAGRVGTPSTENLILGFSWLKGDIYNGTTTVSRSRIGFDLAHYFKQWETLFEISGGENEDFSTFNTLAELSWRSPLENLHSYGQFRKTREKQLSGWEDGSSIALGLNWAVTPKFNISGEWFKELESLSQNDTAQRFVMQFRVRL
jgi:hypothetical protein